MRHIQQASSRHCIPLNVQSAASATAAPLSRTARLRLVALGAVAAGLMSVLSLSTAESRPVVDPAEAAAEIQVDGVRIGPHAQRCVEMAMGHSVRRLAFEAALHQDRIDPFHDTRLAGALHEAASRCHAAFETAHGSYNQYDTADWEG